MSRKVKIKHRFTLTYAAKLRLVILFIMLVGLGIWTRLTFSEPTSPEQVAEQVKQLEAIYTQGNYIEAGLWSAIALGFGVRTLRQAGIARYHPLMTSLTFLCLGISDIIEVQTGAWWRPWWLLLWKSLCIFSLVVLLIFYLKTRPSAR